MEMGVLWDMKAEAQCGRQLHPHPQDRGEWDSGVLENNICWWSHSYRGTVGRRRSLGMGLCCCSWAGSEAVPWQQGVTLRNPQPCSPFFLTAFAFTPPAGDVCHSGKWTFASPHEHSCSTVFHHLHHYCTSMSTGILAVPASLLGIPNDKLQ